MVENIPSAVCALVFLKSGHACGSSKASRLCLKEVYTILVSVVVEGAAE